MQTLLKLHFGDYKHKREINMREKVKKHVNKNLKMLLVIGLIVVMALGFLLMLISGNDEERSQVPIDPTAEQAAEKEDKKDKILAQSNDHPGVSDTALALYNARVDDIGDTAQVAQLMEASGMKTELGDFVATLDVKGENDVIEIAFDKKLREGEDNAFNEIATWYAEQFLVLVEEADEIKWTYSVESKVTETGTEKAADKSDSDKKDSKSDKSDKETAVTENKVKKQEQSLTLEQASELLNVEDIRMYSESPEMVQTLLNNQKGIV